MKLKWIPIVAVLVIGLTLAGCGAGVEASTSAGGIASKQLSDAESLALGTLKLEDTSQAVNAAQALNPWRWERSSWRIPPRR